MDRGRRGNALVLVPFVALHVAALALAIVVPFDRSLLWWLAGSYGVRMFGVTAGYHRYFSHRSYKLSRVGAVRDGRAGADLGPEGRAVVGGPPPRPPPTLRPPRTSTRRAKASGGRTSAGSCRREHDHYDPRRVADFGRYPGAALAGPLPLGADAGVWRRGAGCSAAWPRSCGASRRHGPALPRHVRHQLARPHLGLAAVCDRRRQPQQLPAGAGHARRGLAQQPPPLPLELPPGLPLVGDRRHLRRAAAARAALGIARDLRPFVVREGRRAA